MIELNNVTVRYGEETPLKGFSAALPDMGVVAVYGPSGKGKSTFLKLISGLVTPTEGDIKGADAKKLAVVFQEDRLLPWMTALENVTLVCDDEERALKALEAVEMTSAAKKSVRELSGGMKRRVAIARALAYGGDVLLLDEPFTGLDDALKTRIVERIKGAFALTVIATHDADEAKALGASHEIVI